MISGLMRKRDSMSGKKKERTAAAAVAMKKFEIDKKKLLVSAGIVIGVLVVFYLIFSFYFMSHFFFRTTLNGMKVSGNSAAKVKQRAEDGVNAYELKIIDRDGNSYSIAGQDFSLREQENDGIRQLIKKQNGFAWIGKLFAPDQLELAEVMEYDKAALEECLKEQEFMEESSQTAPVSASVSEYSADSGYTMVPSVPGTEVDEDVLMLEVEKCILALDDELVLADAGCYIEPEISDDDERLLAAVDTLNAYAKAAITYEVGEDTQKLDVSTFKDWLKVSKKMKVSIDKDQVAEYVSALAKKYNTCYSAKKLKTTWGPEVQITNSHYGWKVDQEAEASQIIEEIKNGETVSRDLNYSMTANSHTGNDYGDSYVEINLTAQHLYLYQNGKQVLDTDFVSGNVSRGNGTPCGAFSLTYKQKDATLNGANYSTPVSYWMPFYGNYGMHDASWRSKFGGSIYKTNGSHGCVNLPVSVAEKIFEVVDTNYPVLVYELEGTAPVDENAEAIEAAKKEAAPVTEAIKKAVGSKPSEVTLDYTSAIEEVRKAYDALSDTAKKYVDNYDSLKAAEEQIKKLKEEEETEKNDSDNNTDSKQESGSGSKKKSSTESSESGNSKKNSSTESSESGSGSKKKSSTESSESGSSKKNSSSESNNSDSDSNKTSGSSSKKNSSSDKED